MGDCRKYLYQIIVSWNSKGKWGSLDWNSEDTGGVYGRRRGIFSSGFPEVKYKLAYQPPFGKGAHAHSQKDASMLELGIVNFDQCRNVPAQIKQATYIT